MTRDILGLNTRDELQRARQATYEAHLSHLHRAAGSTQPAVVDRIRDAVRSTSCGVVWLEMKRQRESIDEIKNAFARAPYALLW